MTNTPVLVGVAQVEEPGSGQTVMSMTREEFCGRRVHITNYEATFQS